MCITEYDEAKNYAHEREEGREEGRAEGRAEGEAKGTIKTLLGLIKDGILSEDSAAKRANMTVQEFRKLAAQFG